MPDVFLLSAFVGNECPTCSLRQLVKHFHRRPQNIGLFFYHFVRGKRHVHQMRGGQDLAQAVQGCGGEQEIVFAAYRQHGGFDVGGVFIRESCRRVVRPQAAQVGNQRVQIGAGVVCFW